MAADNVTPIYGEWLVRHIDYYKFCGGDAQTLKADLLSIDIDSSESDHILVECYQRFLSMFVYDIYDTAFEQYAEGIMAVNNKAFLVNNQYGVWAPVGLMEESGKGAGLNLDYTNSTVNRKLNEKIAEVELFQKECEKPLEVLGTLDKKRKPSKIMACVAGVLCIVIAVWFIVIVSDKQIPSSNFQFPMVIVWGGAGLVVLWSMISVLCEIRAIRGWKRLESLKEFFQDFSLQKGANNSLLSEYKEELAFLEQKGDRYDIPKPAKNYSEYILFLDNNVRDLRTIIKKRNQLYRKIGRVIIPYLIIILLFVAYGQNHWGILDLLRHTGNDGNLPERDHEIHENIESQPILSSVTPVSIVDAVASSELTVNGYTFAVINSYDGDVETCWQEGTDNDGTGEVLVYYFDQPRYIAAMDIINGRVISEEKFYDNNRIKTVTLYFFLDGSVTTSKVINFEDVYRTEPVRYDLTEGVMDESYYCEGIQIVIESVYVGDKYDDLCLTEIQFYEGIYQ